MKYLDVLHKRLNELSDKRSEHIAELESITDAAAGEERSALNEAEEVRFAEVTAAIAAVDGEIAAAEARAAELEGISARQSNAKRAPVGGMLSTPTPTEAARLTDTDARSAAVTMIEKNRRFIKDDHRSNVIDLIENSERIGGAVARMALVTGSDDYFRGWSKYMTGNSMAVTEAERAALSMGFDQKSPEERGMTSGTGNSGGYFVPVFIDPTQVITGAGSTNPFRQISTVKTIGPAFGGWYGVTAAQVTAAWTTEASAAPDNTPTLSQPNIPVYMAEAFAAVSYQAFEDIADLAGDVLALFLDAKDNLEATAHASGTGSSQPTGISYAISTTAASRVYSTTSGQLGLVDAFALANALPERFAGSANLNWASHIAVANKLRQLAMAQNSANSVWTDMALGKPASLLGAPIRRAGSMASSLTTGQSVLLYGDFSRYYIIDRIGFSTEFIPNLFDTSSGRPTAQRGWMSHWRTGANAVDVNAFRILQL